MTLVTCYYMTGYEDHSADHHNMSSILILYHMLKEIFSVVVMHPNSTINSKTPHYMDHVVLTPSLTPDLFH